MKHDKHLNDLPMLYFYNELSDTERIAFQAHLDECPVCQAELKRLQALKRKVDCAPQPVPSQRLLAEMNRRVMLEIAGGERPPAIVKAKELLEEFYELVTNSMARPRYQLIAAGLTFVIGIFVGKLWLSSGLRHDPEMLANFVSYNYHFTDPEENDIQKAIAGYLLKSGGVEVADLAQPDRNDENNGLVEVNVRVEKNLAIKGGLDDPTIQNMLMYAARQEADPARRLRAVRLLGQAEPSLEIDATLAAVMLHDQVESIRLLAAQLLNDRAPNEQRLEAYKSVVLHDSSATIRKMALNNLVRQGGQDILPVIALVAARDDNEEIRQLARGALSEIYSKDNLEHK